ncbi:MAG: cytochrome b/b6 domain-containing protein [Candidatus Thiodiazotropha sp.]
MHAKTVSHVLVWSRWLRLAHWTLALSTLGLIATGWLMSIDLAITSTAGEIHYLLSGVFLPALLLRLYLLFFGQGTDLLTDCEPNMHRLNQAWLVVRFYLTLGKAPLPKWYSHNPLWGPIYIALFFILTLSTLSGLMLLNDLHLLGSISMLDLHQLCYQIILIFTVLHLPAVFTHDLSSKSGDISAMVNGFRAFDVGEGEAGKSGSPQAVSLDALMKQLKR